MPYLAMPGTTQRNPSGQYPYRYAYTYMGLGRSRGGYPHPVMRRRGMGDILSDLQGVVSGGATGATVGGPVGAIVGAAPGIISTFTSLFGQNPNSTANLTRQQHVYSLYSQAMTLPGSASSVDAVVNLYTMATQQYDPIEGVQQNNPATTRQYAQTALNRLAQQGWINVNTLNPTYVGSAAISSPTGALTPTSQLGGGSGFSLSPTMLLLMGLAAFAVLK